tara:strand:- start:11 stop:181 length:171 start_codon:yes stop_codon:yes gene_type:complete
MNITSAQHTEDDFGNKNIKATIDGQVMFVPISESNRHYAAILEWAKEDGNTIQEAD